MPAVLTRALGITPICALCHILETFRRAKYSCGSREGFGIVTETTKAVSPSVIARVIPLLGLGAALIVNAAWIAFLGYWIFRLV